MAPERAVLPEPEALAPAGLVAELSVSHPESTWRKLRALGAPASELLPSSFQLLAGSLLGLPALGASSLDADVPIRGVVVLSNGEPRGVLALHVLDGAELVASLTTGAHPPFRAERDAATRMTVLSPVTPESGSGAVLGVLGSYVLVSPERQALLDAGPFVVRTLAKRPPSTRDLSVSVEQKPLREVLVPALRASWGKYRGALERMAEEERKAHADRSADFADPRAVLLASDAALEQLFAVLDGTRRVELSLDAADAYCALSLSLSPDASGPAKELADSVGGSDARALLRLPDSTLLALGSTREPRDGQAAAESAGDQWVRVLGERLRAQDAKLVRDTLADWERGRGASTQYGLLAGASLSAFVATPVADPEALERAAHGFLRLLELPGIRAPLAQFVGAPSVAESKASPLAGAGATLRFAARDKAHPSPGPLELRWKIAAPEAFAAAGPQVGPALSLLESAAHGQSALAGVPLVVDAVARLGQQTSLYAYLDARALGAPAVAPVLLGFGRRDNLPAVYWDVSKGAIALAVQRWGER